MHFVIFMNGIYSEKVLTVGRRLRELGGAVVAFSGGADSSVLAALAREELGSEKTLAVTALSPSFPKRDRQAVVDFCSARGIGHRFIETGEWGDEVFLANPPDRCYHCKRHLFKAMAGVCKETGLHYIVEGTNASELEGHRPGYRASCENKRVVTPLADAGLTKIEERRLAAELELPSAKKPSSACLSSRVPTGEKLFPELLKRIDSAEEAVRAIGAGQVRVRHHGDIARIEVEAQDMLLCLAKRAELTERLRGLGWKFVTLDMAGYRTGGMRS